MAFGIGIGWGFGLRRGGSAAAASPYLLRDTFTDTNGTALGSHAMDVGGGWVKDAGGFAGGNLTIQSNKARSAGATATMYVADAGIGNVTVTTDMVSVSGASFPCAAIRYLDGNNFFAVGVAPVAGSMRIFEVLAGAVTQRASASLGGATTSWTQVVTCSGSSISVTINGVTASYNSAATGRTKFGLRCDATDVCTWDDFTVTA